MSKNSNLNELFVLRIINTSGCQCGLHIFVSRKKVATGMKKRCCKQDKRQKIQQEENIKAADRDEDTHQFCKSLLLIEFYMLGIPR